MTFSSTVPEYLVEFSQDEFDELAQKMPAELAFKETDHSLLAGQTLQMCVWDAQNIEPPVGDQNPASRTELVELVALQFPFTLFGKAFVRYYSAAVAERTWSDCQNVAAPFGINVSAEDAQNSMHPVNRFVECRYNLGKKQTPLILRSPGWLHRREYPGWLQRFMLHSFTLLLNGSLSPKGGTPRRRSRRGRTPAAAPRRGRTPRRRSRAGAERSGDHATTPPPPPPTGVVTAERRRKSRRARRGGRTAPETNTLLRECGYCESVITL